MSAAELALGGDREWTIEPRRPSLPSRVREVWTYRRLLKYFGAQALARTYARTKLGGVWLVLRPSIPVVLGAFVFGKVLGVGSGGVPYLLFYLVGMAIWQVFAQALMWSTRSLELNRRLVRKLYFPRILLPLAYITPALVDLVVYAGLILGASAYYFFRTGVWYLRPEALLLTPLAVALALAMAVALALWTAVLGAEARDVRFTLGYLLNFWYFLTPVIYPMASVEHGYHRFLILNPMSVVVELFRGGILGGRLPGPAAILAVAAAAAVIFAGGWVFFSRHESIMLDRI